MEIPGVSWHFTSQVHIVTQVPSILEYLNQRFIFVAFVNRRFFEKSTIHKVNCFYFLLLVKIFQNVCHL